MARTTTLLTLLSLLSVAGLAAGCGGGKAPSAGTTPHNGGGGVAGPPYAALFTDGAALRYAFVSTASMYDPDDPKANEAGQVVDRTEAAVDCKVEARQLGAWQAARLSCTPAVEDEAGQYLTAVYVADAKGVWRTDSLVLPTDDATAAALAAGDMLLAAVPVADEKREEEAEEGFGSMRSVKQADDGAWCAAWGSWGGDEGGGSACFAAGRGLTKVTWYWAGGSTRDLSYELAKP